MIRKIISACILSLAACCFAGCNDDDAAHHITELRLVRMVPSTGLSGEQAKILGTNFSPEATENIVTINGKTARVIAAAKDELSILLPENEAGTYDVKVESAGRVAEGLRFTYMRMTARTYIVSTLAGTRSGNGLVDGIGTEAQLGLPRGLSFAPDGSLYFTDSRSHAIRRLGTDMSVTTLVVGNDDIKSPWQGAFDSKGNYYVASKDKGSVVKIAPDMSTSVFASGIKTPMCVVCDKDDNVYVAARDSKSVIKYTPQGQATEYASLADATAGPNCIALDSKGNLVIGATSMRKIVMVTPSGDRLDIVGNGEKVTEYDDGEPGDPLTAKIGSNIFGLAFDAEDRLYIADASFHTIRILTPDENGDYTKGTLETVAGTGKAGYGDGIGLKASFNNPYGVTPSPDGSMIYVADSSNELIRGITVK